MSSTPRFSARATNQRPEDLERWDRTRSTPRSARSNQEVLSSARKSNSGRSAKDRAIAQNASSVDTSKKSSPRKSPRISPRSSTHSNSHADSSTRDFSNAGERAVLSDIPELKEHTDLDDYEESHGILTIPANRSPSMLPPPASGRPIGRNQDSW